MRLKDAAAFEVWAALVAEARAPDDGRDPNASLEAVAAAGRAYLRGDLPRALEELGSAADHFEQDDRALPAASLVRLERARILVEAGRPDEAQAELERGVAFFRKAKATWLIGHVTQWAASVGLRAAVTA